MTPLVSVVVPSHNRARLLSRTLQSILAQQMGDLEVVVVDDGSTDDTASVAAAADPRVVVLRNEARWADRLALRDPRRDVTWSELGQDVRWRALALAGRMSRGDRLLVLSGNRVEMVETYFACAWASVVAVPVNPRSATGELVREVEGALIVVGTGEELARVA